MKYTVKAYNNKSSEYPLIGIFMDDKEIDVVEVEVLAQGEDEAIGKARLLIREREKYEVIKAQ